MVSLSLDNLCSIISWHYFFFHMFSPSSKRTSLTILNSVIKCSIYFTLYISMLSDKLSSISCRFGDKIKQNGLKKPNYKIFHLIFMQILFAKWSFLWVISTVYESTDQHIKSTDFFLRKRGFSVVKSAFKFSYFILKKYL